MMAVERRRVISGERRDGAWRHPALLHAYRLKFTRSGNLLADEIGFDAADAWQALIIAHREAHRGTAELWQDGEKLCTISGGRDAPWEIGCPGRVRTGG